VYPTHLTRALRTRVTTLERWPEPSRFKKSAPEEGRRERRRPSGRHESPCRYDYEIIETLECGIMLSGSEVKSLREGKAQIAESYARFDDTELWLYQMHVPPWVYATGFGSHDPTVVASS